MIKPVDRLSDNALCIFLFHGVIIKNNYEVRNYTRKHLEKDYFATIIRGLKKNGYPLSMDEAVNHIQNGESFPPGAFAVTFDDGFENNYSVAAPILLDMKVPATFYVTTSFIEHNTMSWIDRIEYCMEKSDFGSLSLPWNNEKQIFQSTKDKIELLDEIRLYVKKDSSADVDALVADVFEQCGIKPIYQSDDQLDKKMCWTNVCELAENRNFIIGGHTHTHSIMSFLSKKKLEREISGSLSLLQEKTDVSPGHYSYPEGLAHCYSEKVIMALKRYGVICCPTAIDGMNTVSDDLFHLKRIMVT